MENFQRKVQEFAKEYDVENTPQFALLDVFAELGEVGKEILKSTNYGKSGLQPSTEIEDEIGDVFYSLIVLANGLDIDLLKSLDKTLLKYSRRHQGKGSIGSAK